MNKFALSAMALVLAAVGGTLAAQNAPAPGPAQTPPRPAGAAAAPAGC